MRIRGGKKSNLDRSKSKNEMNINPTDSEGKSSWDNIILPNIPNLHGIQTYIANGGYEAFKKALEMKPEAVTDEVKKSNLRGRGGACFPTGLKWTFMPKQTTKVKYLCVNGHESEPGTFKDRQIFESNPHLMIEGTLIACYAMGINTAYIYVRGEYGKWIHIVEKALAEAYEKGFVGEKILGKDFSTNVYVHKGAGAYICGEESALMNSIEGERGYPRVKPPFPASVGAYEKLTKEESHKKILELMRLVGIPEAEIRMREYPHQFSGGIMKTPSANELTTRMLSGKPLFHTFKLFNRYLTPRPVQNVQAVQPLRSVQIV
ncbi:MAG: NADH dehydrogenase subunit F [Bacteroidetes bacterium]|nr:NADH dehydrogenase subunit F [Bacteroidota bacterium]